VRATKRILGWLGLALLAGCRLDLGGNFSPDAAVVSGALLSPAPGGSAAGLTSAGEAASRDALAGVVLGLDGKPAAGVQVRLYLITDNGAGLITENGAGLITDNGAGIVSNHSGAYRKPAQAYRTATLGFRTTALAAEARTDAAGRFTLARLARGASANVEAVQSDDVKAMAQGIGASSGSVELRLALTGRIRGAVRSASPGADLLGVDVFVPGSGYLAKTDSDGSYEIGGIPPGSYRLVALHADFGRALASGVVVASRNTTLAPDLRLEPTKPVVTRLSAQAGAPGDIVEIHGARFGVAEGKQPTVHLGGLQMEVATASDTAIRAVVPPKAGSGNLEVRVGQQTVTAGRFLVVTRVEIMPPWWADEATRVTDPETIGDAPADDILAAGLVRRYLLRGAEPDGRPVAPVPGARWSLHAAPGVATLSADGELQALAPGTASLEARLGALRNTTYAGDPVEFTVAITPSVHGAKIGARPDALFTLADRDHRFDLPTVDVIFTDGATQAMRAIWSTGDASLRFDHANETVAGWVSPGAAPHDVALVARPVAALGQTLGVTLPLRRAGMVNLEIWPTGAFPDTLWYVDVEARDGETLVGTARIKRSSQFTTTKITKTLVVPVTPAAFIAAAAYDPWDRLLKVGATGPLDVPFGPPVKAVIQLPK
jgi:hypothetical protein